jgi:Methyltransferase domain
VGQLAPFFLKRVFHLELHGRVSSNPMKRWIQLLAGPGKHIFAKLFGDSAFIEMQVCKACSFVQATHPFSEEAIMRLYLDYRAETYNSERIKYEPTYRAWADRVGTDEIEIKVRVKAATEWLADKIHTSEDFTMLDFGGADGRFLPKLPAQKFVYEVSSIAPLPGITRIAKEDDLGSYSYVHLAHVLEHVVNPLKVVESITPHIKPGGYLYIEVPQEMTDSELNSLQNGTYKLNIPIHEHINKYSVHAISHLMQAVGLEFIASRADQIDVGWAQAVHIRALGRKVS